MITVEQARKKWGCSQQRVRQWLYEGRIPGARKIGRDWAIPLRAKRPRAIK